MDLDSFISRLQTLRERHGGNIPVHQSTPSTLHGHDTEYPVTEAHIGFISEQNPIRRSGDLDPQIDRVTIFRYPRFKNLMDDVSGIIQE